MKMTTITIVQRNNGDIDTVTFGVSRFTCVLSANLEKSIRSFLPVSLPEFDNIFKSFFSVCNVSFNSNGCASNANSHRSAGF